MFSTFRFSDFLDIVLVAAIIYICVRIIRETRAMQLIKGIFFLACVYIIVSLLEMEASTYMFESIFSNILLIIAVIFALSFAVFLNPSVREQQERALNQLSILMLR